MLLEWLGFKLAELGDKGGLLCLVLSLLRLCLLWVLLDGVLEGEIVLGELLVHVSQ